MMVDFASKLEEPKKKKRVDFAAKLKQEKDATSAFLVGQQELGEPGLKSPLGRFAIAQGNTTGEKIRAFKEVYPEGDLRADFTGEFLFREDPSQPYRKVEGPGFEPVNDLIEFLAADTGSIMGEVIATARTKGVSLIPLLGRIFVGGAGGELAQQGAQEVLGVGDERLPDMVTRAGTKGAVAAGFGAAGFGAAAGIDRLTGGVLDKRPGMERVEEASGQIEDITGVEQTGLTLGQSAALPLIRRLEGQSGSTFSTIQNHLNLQQANMVKALKTLRQGGRTAEFATQPLEKTLRKETNDLVNSLKAKGSTFEEGGMSLTKGVENYKVTSGYIVDEAYDFARRIEEPEFDVSLLRDEAQKAVLGVPGAKSTGEVIELSDEVPSELIQLVKDIRDWDPDQFVLLDGEPVPVTEQLRALQRRAADLMEPPPGRLTKTPANARAAKVWGAIKDTLDNPSNKNGEFVAAWKNANKFASMRFKTLERAAFVKAAKSESPTSLARDLAQPFKSDELKFYRSVVPTDEFKILQDSFKTDLAINSDAITSRLSKFDKDTLDLLMSPAEQKLFRETGKKIDDLNAVKFQEVLDRQATVGGMIDELVLKRNDTARVKKLQDIVARNGGAVGPLGRQIRAGIIDTIISKAIKQQAKGTLEEVSGLEIRSMMKIIEDSGADAFLLPQDITALKAFADLSASVRPSVDVGASMAAGGAAEAARGIVTGDMVFDGLRTLMEMSGTGNFLVSPTARKLLLERRSRSFTFRQYMALAGAIAGDISVTASEQEQLKKIESSL